MGTQLQSIAVFSRVMKELSEASLTAPVEDAVKQGLQQTVDLQRKNFLDTLSKVYTGKTVGDVARDFGVLQKLNRRTPLNTLTEHLVAKLTKEGLLKAPLDSPWCSEALEGGPAPKPVGKTLKLQTSAVTTPAKSQGRIAPAREQRRLQNEDKLRIKKVVMKPVDVPIEITGEATVETTRHRSKARNDASPIFTSTIEATALSIAQLPRIGPAVPNLCHDLSRVLFNPGIYQLQDPRSRVYNFDPYLEKIMPISDFDFNVLKEYITSSRDENLRSLALQHGKKYVGSSSSMTSTLAQFHFLLSQWRDINTEALSRGFSDTMKSFTTIQRSPSSVFLRYQDGVYAMDADKEYDSGNILMSLGKSMEKLLTQRPQNFERYRKTSDAKIPEHERNAPEAYQYTHSADFLMRAQLDAHDSRLPGTGTFDLKTRAVASIRHNIQQHEEGVGYQIKTRYGDWESYEREYFDMMRSAFLKYSLQVRLGQMDGIFVAFHNIERIFGFQYICLPEMDMALHGQYDTTLGDQEFKFSVEMLNRVLNRVTEKFPKRSVRLHFETRDLAVGGVFMQIFAEPMDEANIEAIQNSRKEAVDAFEHRLMNPELYPETQEAKNVETMFDEQHAHHDVAAASPPTSASSEFRGSAMVVGESTTDEHPVCDDASAEVAEQTVNDKQTSSDNAPIDLYTTEKVKGAAETIPNTELLALTLRIQNRVNNNVVDRPTHLTSLDKWTIDFNLQEEAREQLAQTQYRASKARRRTALEARAQNPAANYYLRKLREMASSGAEWRKAQDEMDANRERVVLYEDSRPR